jgi:DNA-binding NtrC family response regulator
MNGRIFVCDDEEEILRYLRKLLGARGYQVETFSGPLQLLQSLEEAEGEGNLLLLDVKMPELDGIEVLRRVKETHPSLPVIMMTGHGTIDSAVEAMKLGAWDFLTKPFPQEKLFSLVQNCLERERLVEENTALKRELRERTAPGSLIFQSARFTQVYELALRVAESDSSVLVLGESGTGKELVAAAVHANSPRAGRRFLPVNCAAFSESLLESQLFGHVKGAFTGAVQNHRGLLEEAGGGTLFLDEVAELSPGLQAKLLRVLQFGEFIPVGSNRPRRVDVRFIAATNRDLEREIREGRFREDLFYRLNVIALHLPALRERPEDIPLLATHFLARIAQKTRRPAMTISAEALALMREYSWPGNVRELENVIERGTILARGEMITPEVLPFRVEEISPHLPTEEGALLTLQEIERRQVLRALRQTDWNKTRTAELLGVTRKTIDRKVKEFNLTP